MEVRIECDYLAVVAVVAVAVVLGGWEAVADASYFVVVELAELQNLYTCPYCVDSDDQPVALFLEREEKRGNKIF